MNIAPDVIIEKIQKLLQLANSDNENEAKTAASKASALLVRYNLELQQVQDKDFDYGQVSVLDIPQLKWHQKHITDLMQQYFFVMVIFSSQYREDKGKRVQVLKFVGKTANCKIAAYVFSYLNDVYPRLWWKYKDAQFAEGIKLYKNHRESYFSGLTHGISLKLKEERFKVEEEFGLVLVKDERLEKVVDDICKGRTKQTSEKEIHPEIQMQGFKDGLKVQLKKGIETEVNDTEVLLLTNGGNK